MRSRLVLSAALAVMLAGCAGTPDSRYYTLSAAPPQGGNVTAGNGYRLAAVHLPSLYDRPELVFRNGPNSVDFAEFDRWAEPLERMAGRILAEDMALRYPQAPIGPARLQVTIDDFMADRSGVVFLSGTWQLSGSGDQQSHSGRFSLSQPVSGLDGDKVAGAMSVLLGRLADDLGRI